MFFQIFLNAKKKKYVYTYISVYTRTSVILLNEEMELPAGSGGCWFHSGAAPPPESVGWGVGFLPPPRSSPRAGCGEGQASADVTQLPSFSKEMRTVGWQSVCFHICSFRILRCYSTHCLTPAALGFSTALLPRLGRGQGRGGRGSQPPSPRQAAAPTWRRVVHPSLRPGNWDNQQPLGFLHGAASSWGSRGH